jgi:hypothetical protein
MNLSIDQLKIALECLRFATDVYEDQDKTIQQSPSEHLVYLKEKALIKQINKALTN